MLWFTANVEDIQDPKQLGRIKVRIHGLHCESKTPNIQTGKGIDTDTLPWALPMQDITSAADAGIGRSPTGMQVGTQVVGFSRDKAYNDLIIMGTIAGMPNGVSDINTLATGKDHTMVDTKSSVVTGVSKANGKGSWSEPKTKYAAKYPNNHVTETPNGIIIEIDDTAGVERINIFHPSGSFHEIHPDGTMVTKSNADDYEIIQKDKNLSITGSININTGSNCNIKALGDCDIEAEGNTKIVTKDCDIEASGNIKAKANGNATIVASTADIEASGNVSINAGGSANINSALSAQLLAAGAVLISGSSVILKGSKTVVI